MSIKLPSARVKYFFFDTKDRRDVERGIGGKYIADTTSVSYTLAPGEEKTFKTYSFNAVAKTNKMRIRIYGYCEVSGAIVRIYVNNVLVVSFNIPASSSEIFIGEHYHDLEPGSNYRVDVRVYNSATTSITVYITRVYVIAGYALTSTSSVDILTINLDPNNDVYNLKVNGNFVYRLGVRWWVKGNRKTTATASLFSTLANSVHSTAVNNLEAGDDGDNEIFLRISTGDYATSFTISGYVGAEGDIIIITSIFCQIVLRGIISDSYGHGAWVLVIREKGLMVVNGRHLTIDGTGATSYVAKISPDTYVKVWETVNGTDIVFNSPAISIGNIEYVFHTGASVDSLGKLFTKFLTVAVIGE